MNTLDRLKTLHAARTWRSPLSTDGYSIRGDHEFARLVNLGSGGREIGELMVEATNALAKLLAVIDAAKDVLLSTQAPVDRELAMQESLSELLNTLNALEETK